jgi:hypothetical protein
MRGEINAFDAMFTAQRHLSQVPLDDMTAQFWS